MASSEGPLLAIREARFRWPRGGQDVVRIDRLDVAPGERVFIRGPSGSGKSTLLSLVTGIVLARSGSVSLLGRDWAALSAPRRDAFRADHVGYIFQQFNLLPYLSVLDNALLPVRFSSLRRRRAGEARETARRLLARAGLDEPLWGRGATELSVGQQQRVAAVRALIGRPELVVADEPTSALDEALRESFMDLLCGCCAEAGSALLFVSHDRRLAARFDRVLDMDAFAAPRAAAA